MEEINAMRIIKPGFEIMSPVDGEAVLKYIEQCGRVCYKSEDKITGTSAATFAANIIKRGHESVLDTMPSRSSSSVTGACPTNWSGIGWHPIARRVPDIATMPRTVLAMQSPLSSQFF